MYVTISEATEITGIEKSWLKRKCINGVFKSAKKAGSMWFIDDRELKGEKLDDCDILPFDYISVTEYCAINNCKSSAVRLRIKKGLYPTAKKVGKTWLIPKDAEFIELKSSGSKKSETLSGNKNSDGLVIHRFSTYDENKNTPIR